MTERFKVGDRVSWNSEAGRVSGKIVKVHTKDVNYKGYVHHASEDEPQYEIKSDKTDHVALHKAGALRLPCVASRRPRTEWHSPSSPSDIQLGRWRSSSTCSRGRRSHAWSMSAPYRARAPIRSTIATSCPKR